MNNQLLEAALKYVSLGWYVFPLAPGQKVPITKHGVKDATTDEAQVRKWWVEQLINTLRNNEQLEEDVLTIYMVETKKTDPVFY